MEEVKPYGAIIILDSSWCDDDEICVDFPKEIQKNVKLSHDYKHKGHYYCLPNEHSGYFGAVVSQGKTMKEAIDKCNEYAEQIICLGLSYTRINYDKAAKYIKDGRKYGIDF
jgi:hypothetical protein